MRFIFCVFLLTGSVLCGKGQQYRYQYFLNDEFASVDKKNAVMIGKGFYEDSLFRLDGFNPYTNSIILKAHFADSLLTSLQGHFVSYYPNGIVENDGYFIDNYRDGPWSTRNEKGLITDSVFYEQGEAVATAKYYYSDKNILTLYELTDSLHDKYIYRSFFPNGNKQIEAVFSGTTGSLKEYDQSGTDSHLALVGSSERTTAKFAGGDTAYWKYRYENLDHGIGVKHGVDIGIYFVKIAYIVEADGSISDPRPITKYGHHLETEAIRFIKTYPKMIPAKFFGIPVRSFVVQVIPFRYN